MYNSNPGGLSDHARCKEFNSGKTVLSRNLYFVCVVLFKNYDTSIVCADVYLPFWAEKQGPLGLPIYTPTLRTFPPSVVCFSERDRYETNRLHADCNV